MAQFLFHSKETKWQPTYMFLMLLCPVCNTRTLEEIINLLKDAVHFGVFDSTKGFFHVPMDEASIAFDSNVDPS